MSTLEGQFISSTATIYSESECRKTKSVSCNANTRPWCVNTLEYKFKFLYSKQSAFTHILAIKQIDVNMFILSETSGCMSIITQKTAILASASCVGEYVAA